MGLVGPSYGTGGASSSRGTVRVRRPERRRSRSRQRPGPAGAPPTSAPSRTTASTRASPSGPAYTVASAVKVRRPRLRTTSALSGSPADTGSWACRLTVWPSRIAA